jgi:hypothetical protein
MASAVMPYARPPRRQIRGCSERVVTIVSEQAAQADTVRTYLRRDATSGSAQNARGGGGGDAPVVDGSRRCRSPTSGSADR